ncbi:MAG TPA: SDR family NAD(P)-dependent oxidoreductase [Anaerolineaceae bacterium]|nr:SDR family NAD(P)-dependent oxidoreductase [Anaerolineaceae bacterium]
MDGKTLITGGAGFIGVNYAARCLSRGQKVVIYDNLSRSGADLNLEWLSDQFGRESFTLVKGDVRDADAVKKAAKDAQRIVHLAGQVAVTTSVKDPRTDFEVNALGTFNTLEAARASGLKPVFVYASTNKVYGGMENVVVEEQKTRYAYKDLPEGADETQLLDFHSPYGCSKGSGDQYVRDYHRIYGLPTVVLRQSCIYGTRQFGIEDQGWVAWFIIAAVTGRPITIYGNGKQVRDILFIDDLLDAYDLALEQPTKSAGQVFNIGGGPKNTISVWAEFRPMLEKLVGHEIKTQVRDWRPGDQPVYVSNIGKAQSILGWSPKITAEEGIRRLYSWIIENRSLFE